MSNTPEEVRKRSHRGPGKKYVHAAQRAKNTLDQVTEYRKVSGKQKILNRMKDSEGSTIRWVPVTSCFRCIYFSGSTARGYCGLLGGRCVSNDVHDSANKGLRGCVEKILFPEYCPLPKVAEPVLDAPGQFTEEGDIYVPQGNLKTRAAL